MAITAAFATGTGLDHLDRDGADYWGHRRRARPGAGRFRSRPVEADTEVTWPSCPKKAGVRMLSLSTGAVVDGQCESPSCPHCGLHQLRLWARAIEEAGRPTHHVVLTLAPRSLRETRERVKYVAKKFRRRFPAFKHVWVREDHDVGVHLHMLVHGCEGITKSIVRDVATAAGFGDEVGFERLKTPAHVHHASRYLVKPVKLRAKTKAAADAVDGHLDLNGGRVVHVARGFLRDGDGNPLSFTEWKKVHRRRRHTGPWIILRGDAYERVRTDVEGVQRTRWWPTRPRPGMFPARARRASRAHCGTCVTSWMNARTDGLYGRTVECASSRLMPGRRPRDRTRDPDEAVTDDRPSVSARRTSRRRR